MVKVRKTRNAYIILVMKSIGKRRNVWKFNTMTSRRCGVRMGAAWIRHGACTVAGAAVCGILL